MTAAGSSPTPPAADHPASQGRAGPLRSQAEAWQLCLDNLGLVGALMTRLRLQAHPLRDDIESVGRYALFRAGLYWNPDISTFSTYATWSAYRSICRYLGLAGRHNHLSLDRLALDADGDTVGDLIADPRQPDPADQAGESIDLAELCEQALAAVDERARDMLRMRAAGRTLGQIGAAHGISKERARQVMVRARQAIRNRRPELAERFAGGE